MPTRTTRRFPGRSFLVAAAACFGWLVDGPPASAAPPAGVDRRPDIVVVGAGIGGLSAALEAARDGATVAVLDMSSVFGGHAVMSEGDVTMVGTPLQRALKIHDSPDLAYRDLMTWGGDANGAWARYYADRSRADIYDWLGALGVTFDGLNTYPGNSVPRAHRSIGRGLGLVRPIYLACLQNARISFVWNTEVTRLFVKNGRAVGVITRNLRTGATSTIGAGAVVLATGGFESNVDLVRKYWPRELPVPARVLAGSGINSQGSGLTLATEAGGTLHNLDHQWNYERGLPDPRFPGSGRGLNVSIAAAIWVNAEGRRFVNEAEGSAVKLAALLHQSPATFWAIFDSSPTHRIWVSGSGWDDAAKIKRLILDNEAVVKRADTLAALAANTGLPDGALEATVAAYDSMIAGAGDTEFQSFGRESGIAPIGRPPFYAAQFFPLARKSMGGVAIDLSARVVTADKKPIAGLYAAGEVTGLAGINGRRPLEGTFLGPSVLIGRVAGRSAARDLGIVAAAKVPGPGPAPTSSKALAGASGGDCTGCHALAGLIATPRTGFWHFERVHQVVLERGFDCSLCHAGIRLPADSEAHRIDPFAQVGTCGLCHGSP